jgi:hypothetical protein
MAHDGFTNSFHIKANTYLAIKYNDKSPLEMHHSSVAFKILTQDKFNILRMLNRTMFKRLRNTVIEYDFFVEVF